MIEHIDTEDLIVDPLAKSLSIIISRNHTTNVSLVYSLEVFDSKSFISLMVTSLVYAVNV